jgi:hypothetical protein
VACSAGGLGLPQTLQRERQDRRYSERHCEGSHRPVGRDVLDQKACNERRESKSPLESWRRDGTEEAADHDGGLREPYDGRRGSVAPDASVTVKMTPVNAKLMRVPE